MTGDEYRWLPGAIALILLHWAATAGLVGDGIREAEGAMTAAEAWWSRRAETLVEVRRPCEGDWSSEATEPQGIAPS